MSYADLEGLAGLLGIAIVLMVGYILYKNVSSDFQKDLQELEYEKLEHEYLKVCKAYEEQKERIKDLETGLNHFTYYESEQALQRLYEQKVIQQDKDNLEKYFNKSF